MRHIGELNVQLVNAGWQDAQKGTALDGMQWLQQLQNSQVLTFFQIQTLHQLDRITA